MPTVVRKGKGKRPYKIVDKNTGEVKGSSTSRNKAQSSANARNAATYSDWKPTGKKSKKSKKKGK